jgi:Protein of unknown function (DUF3828)
MVRSSFGAVPLDGLPPRIDILNGQTGFGRPAGVSMKMSIVEPSAPTRRLMMAGLMASLAAALAFPAVPAMAGGEPAAKTFLNSIYQNYLGRSSGAAKGVALGNAKQVRSYFTVGLASLILEDRAAAAKRGEPPVLDGDPFMGRQEWDVSNLAVEVKDTGAFKAIGTVSFMNSGKPEKIVIELLRSGNEWRIADIAWDSGTLRGLYRRKAAGDTELAQP